MSIFNKKDVKNFLFQQNIIFLKKVNFLYKKNSLQEKLIEIAIYNSKKLINQYLYKRYSIKIQNTSILLRKITLNVIFHQWYTLNLKNNLPNKLNIMYKSNLKILESLKTGKLKLGI